MAQPQPPKKPPFHTSIFDEPLGPGTGNTAPSPAQPSPKTLLPASWRRNGDGIERAVPDSAFLNSQLGVQRLNDMCDHLWMAGRPMPPRPLHYQQAAARDLIPVEDMNLHLVWDQKSFFAKPMPRYLLSRTFWQDHLVCASTTPGCACSVGSINGQNITATSLQSSQNLNSTAQAATPTRQCERRYLYECALGFMLSYVALVQYESDFHIAKTTHLIPEPVGWPQWTRLVEDLLNPDKPRTVNKRYRYGELRLGRLNTIMRYGQRRYRGYSNWYRTYGDYLGSNLGFILTLTGYIVVVLTAMQVGLATDVLKDNERFQDASYKFTVFFSILLPLILTGLTFLFFAVMFVENWVRTGIYSKKRFAMYDDTQADHP